MKSMSADLLYSVWFLSIPLLWVEIYWMIEHGGMNQKQDDLLFVLTVLTITVLLGCAFLL